LIFLSLAIRVSLHNAGLTHAPWSYQFFPSELVFFLLGVIAYKFYKKYNNLVRSKKIQTPIFLVLILYILLYQFIPSEFPRKSTFFLIVFFSLPFLFQQFKLVNSDRLIGELSYPIYISHKLILFIVSLSFFPKVESIGTTALILTLGLSYILLIFISNPIEKIRQRRAIARTVIP
jgi:peptidoglycan/LPS O-acetylase OafA/YrhL